MPPTVAGVTGRMGHHRRELTGSGSTGVSLRARGLAPPASDRGRAAAPPGPGCRRVSSAPAPCGPASGSAAHLAHRQERGHRRRLPLVERQDTQVPGRERVDQRPCPGSSDSRSSASSRRGRVGGWRRDHRRCRGWSHQRAASTSSSPGRGSPGPSATSCLVSISVRGGPQGCAGTARPGRCHRPARSRLDPERVGTGTANGSPTWLREPRGACSQPSHGATPSFRWSSGRRPPRASARGTMGCWYPLRQARSTASGPVASVWSGPPGDGWQSRPWQGSPCAWEGIATRPGSIPCSPRANTVRAPLPAPVRACRDQSSCPRTTSVVWLGSTTTRSNTIGGLVFTVTM